MENENGQPAKDGTVLWAWVGQDKGETGVARLQTAWIPLGTINLVAFSREVLTDPRLVEALQEQADKDGQTVRLVKFVWAEEGLDDPAQAEELIGCGIGLLDAEAPPLSTIPRI